jgi:hypothetical protein
MKRESASENSGFSGLLLVNKKAGHKFSGQLTSFSDTSSSYKTRGFAHVYLSQSKACELYLSVACWRR